MTVRQLKEEMPYDEWLGWLDYLEKRPLGWREDDRTLKLLQVQGFKGKGSSVFMSLAQMEASRGAAVDEKGKLNMGSFKGSAMFNKILSAQGGDKIDYDQA